VFPLNELHEQIVCVHVHENDPKDGTGPLTLGTVWNRPGYFRELWPCVEAKTAEKSLSGVNL